ncbi:hypothetical protein HPB51_014697 [Rhipicephalus microplus]|uniref:Uncharacterized protein n=1 Tax=Rhipicephalus microplus TaxID=6941 RepID=A0A9J6DNG8_RHIMP|nr:hypothetical protein HPB51_014697 [Rhipicephalus microplus]
MVSTRPNKIHLALDLPRRTNSPSLSGNKGTYRRDGTTETPPPQLPPVDQTPTMCCLRAAILRLRCSVRRSPSRRTTLALEMSMERSCSRSRVVKCVRRGRTAPLHERRRASDGAHSRVLEVGGTSRSEEDGRHLSRGRRRTAQCNEGKSDEENETYCDENRERGHLEIDVSSHGQESVKNRRSIQGFYKAMAQSCILRLSAAAEISCAGPKHYRTCTDNAVMESNGARQAMPDALPQGAATVPLPAALELRS